MLIFASMMVFALALDLFSKEWVFAKIGVDEVRSIIPRVLDFRRSLNDGAVFGSFSGHVEVFIIASVFALGFVLYLFAHSHPVQRWMHVSLGLILSGAIGNLYDRSFVIADIATVRTVDGRESTIIGKVVSEPDSEIIRIGSWPEGARPQTFSRSDVTVRRQGVVRDFLKFTPRFPRWVPYLGRMDMWPWIFNVADSALVCGVILLLLSNRLDRRRIESVREELLSRMSPPPSQTAPEGAPPS